MLLKKNIKIFEGEYLNDRKWKGEGEEYDNFGHLIFKGKYSDDKQTTGNKYRYDIMSKKLRYEGIYKNGKANFERYYNKKGDLFAEIIYENGKIKKMLLKEYQYGDLKYDSEKLYEQIIKEKIHNNDGITISDTEYMNIKNLWKTNEYKNFEFNKMEWKCKTL